MIGTADAYPFPTLPAPLRFGLAFVAVGIVYLLDRRFDVVIDDGSQFLLLATAVMASAWFAGTGPALLATVAGALLGARDAGSTGAAGQMHLALFVLQGLLLTALVAELRRARRMAEQQTREAQRARREGEAANRVKDEFLATLSHELRTPLNVMLGWVQLLKTRKVDATTSLRGLESIERNARLHAQLTSDLLDVSNALTGRLRVDSRPTALNEAARQAANAAGTAANAKGVRIRARIGEAPVAVLGDTVRLHQVVWNLLTNGIKFTPAGGKVGVLVRAVGHRACLIVYDSGPGISPDFLPRIFERFAQQDPSPTRTAGGIGMGLALVRELVELHGGEISARNRSRGRGAVFTVSLPLHRGTALNGLPTRPAAVQQLDVSLSGLRVLVFDPDRDGRELVHAVLHQTGARVRAVGSVADALESLEEWRPDVLVSSNGTAAGDSYSLIGRVQTLDAERGGRIPALALTTLMRRDPRVREMLEGTVRDLPKPVDPHQLTAEIARLAVRDHRPAAR